MKSPVTIGGFDLTTRHDLIVHLVGLGIHKMKKIYNIIITSSKYNYSDAK